MENKNLNENLENLNTDNNLNEDFVFEELNAEGEIMSAKEKAKFEKNNLEEKYKEKIEKLEKERDEYLNGWQRALSDYKNLSKSTQEEKKIWGEIAVKSFIEELFPVLDTYDAARSNQKVWESVDQNWRMGIEYIFDIFKNKLAERGVEKFGNIGDEYDAEFYEAVENIEINNEKNNHKVAQIISSGYKYNGKVLRPSKVKVWIFSDK